MLRTFLLVSLLTACTVEAVPPRASAQAVPRFAILDDYVRDRLAADWDAHQGDGIIMERAYCVRFQRDYWANEPAWRVTQIADADSASATPFSVRFACPHGENVATLHVHPPQSCDSESSCYRGGSYAFQCLPSDNDVRFLSWRRDAFLLIQCDRNAVITVFPPH